MFVVVDDWIGQINRINQTQQNNTNSIGNRTRPDDSLVSTRIRECGTKPCGCGVP